MGNNSVIAVVSDIVFTADRNVINADNQGIEFEFFGTAKDVTLRMNNNNIDAQDNEGIKVRMGSTSVNAVVSDIVFTADRNVINANNQGIEFEFIGGADDVTLKMNNNNIDAQDNEGIKVHIGNSAVGAAVSDVVFTAVGNVLNADDEGIEFQLFGNGDDFTFNLNNNKIESQDKEGIDVQFGNNNNNVAVTDILFNANSNVINVDEEGIEFELFGNAGSLTINANNNQIDAQDDEGIFVRIGSKSDINNTLTGNFVYNAKIHAIMPNNINIIINRTNINAISRASKKDIQPIISCNNIVPIDIKL